MKVCSYWKQARTVDSIAVKWIQPVADVFSNSSTNCPTITWSSPLTRAPKPKSKTMTCSKSQPFYMWPPTPTPSFRSQIKTSSPYLTNLKTLTSMSMLLNCPIKINLIFFTNNISCLWTKLFLESIFKWILNQIVKNTFIFIYFDDILLISKIIFLFFLKLKLNLNKFYLSNFDMFWFLEKSVFYFIFVLNTVFIFFRECLENLVFKLKKYIHLVMRYSRSK